MRVVVLFVLVNGVSCRRKLMGDFSESRGIDNKLLHTVVEEAG